jgi:hypothetical protein
MLPCLSLSSLPVFLFVSHCFPLLLAWQQALMSQPQLLLLLQQPAQVRRTPCSYSSQHCLEG